MESFGGRPQRGPALLLAGILLAYAAGKAAYAAQAKLGLPSGPVVPGADYAKYSGATLGVAANQWIAAASGVVGALLVLVGASDAGRRLPRTPMLLALGLTFVGFGAGAAVMVVDGFVGVGVGWRWYHGFVGLATLALLVVTMRSYARATRSRSARRRARATS